VAVNCWVVPAAIVGALGVRVMEVIVTTGAVTLRFAVPLTPLNVAVMVADPAETPVAMPAAFTVAAAGSELVHVAVVVTFAVELSL
jgi:hypothetical protein